MRTLSAELYVKLNGSVNSCRLRLPPLKNLPVRPVSGWIAVSERIYRTNRGSGFDSEDPCDLLSGFKATPAPPGWLDWLMARQPDAIIGKTIRLYHIADAEGADAAAQTSP